jgi:hypothetical protein
MTENSFRVSLTEAGEPDDDGLRSVRISLKQYIKDLYGLKKDDLLKIMVIGIYENKKALEYTPVDFTLYGKVSIISGKKSLGMTIEKDVVRRRKLRKQNELEITLEVLPKASTE